MAQPEVQEVVNIPTRNLRPGDTIVTKLGRPFFRVDEELKGHITTLKLQSVSDPSYRIYVDIETLDMYNAIHQPMNQRFERSVYAIFRK